MGHKSTNSGELRSPSTYLRPYLVEDRGIAKLDWFAYPEPVIADRAARIFERMTGTKCRVAPHMTARGMTIYRVEE